MLPMHRLKVSYVNLVTRNPLCLGMPRLHALSKLVHKIEIILVL